MEKSDLINSASKIVNVSEKSALEYEKNIPLLVSKMNASMLNREDIDAMIGENNQQMMQDNHANHAQFIASIFNHPNPEVLVETILWVFKAYRSRNFHSSYWAAQLNSWRNIISETLPAEAAKEILPLYHWMQINIPYFNELSDQKLETIKTMHLKP